MSLSPIDRLWDWAAQFAIPSGSLILGHPRATPGSGARSAAVQVLHLDRHTCDGGNLPDSDGDVLRRCDRRPLTASARQREVMSRKADSCAQLAEQMHTAGRTRESAVLSGEAAGIRWALDYLATPFGS